MSRVSMSQSSAKPFASVRSSFYRRLTILWTNVLLALKVALLFFAQRQDQWGCGRNQPLDTVGIEGAVAHARTPARMAPDERAQGLFHCRPIAHLIRGELEPLSDADELTVTEHGGTISLDSQMGFGTTATVRLPLGGATP